MSGEPPPDPVASPAPPSAPATASAERPAAPASPARGRGRLILLLAGGFAIGVVAYLVATADRIPQLDAKHLADARARWQAAAITDYQLELVTEGSDLARGTIFVTVKPGSEPSLTRDGIAGSGDARSYTVDGLLATLDQELHLLERPQAGFGAPPGYRAYLYARFDERGVPVRYRRVVGGISRWAEWRVTGFTKR